jgi:hypothetical protein
MELDGGPIHPTEDRSQIGDLIKVTSRGGMTLRQHYKAAALAGLDVRGGVTADTAKRAAEIADALLAEDRTFEAHRRSPEQ